jgi:hypothetical protein
MLSTSDQGKLQPRDQRMARALAWTPWLTFPLVALPVPILFTILFFVAGSPDSAAVYLLFSLVSLGFGLVIGLTVFLFLYFYRRRWLARLRDRLASDGITAAEVPWFHNELSSEERRTWRELGTHNPLLADAYCETLATRLTATRIAARARAEILRVERQINRTRGLRDVDTKSLLEDLLSDRVRLDRLRNEASVRLSEAKARLQAIEAAGRRSLTSTETEAMLRRLTAAQEQTPLVLEFVSLEQQALKETDRVSSTAPNIPNS